MAQTIDTLQQRINELEKLNETYQEQYLGVFNAARDGFLIIDLEGNVVEANPRACEMYGYSRDEFVKLHGTQIIHPDYHHVFEKFKTDVQKKGEFHAETIDVRKDSSTFNNDVKGTIFNYKGEPHLLATVRDVTEQKKREDIINRLTGIIDTTTDFVSVSDNEGNILYTNPAGLAMIGREGEDPTTHTISNYHPPEMGEKIRNESLPAVMEKGIWTGEAKLLRVDGTVIPTSQVIVLIRDEHGKQIGLGTIMRDITMQKQNEKELKMSQSRIETLLKLSQLTSRPLREITNFALEEAIRLTESQIGYVAFVDNEEETEVTMHAWSKEALENCAIQDKPIKYSLEKMGLWGEALRQRRSIITNDYAAPNPWKRGQPEGHVKTIRHMNAPIFDDGRIVVIAGVGNKETNYDESDVKQLTLLMNGMWQIVKRKQAEDNLKEAKENLEETVAKRTAELEEKIRLIKEQQQTLLELSTPVIEIWHGILVLPLIGTFDSRRAAQLMEDLLEAILDTEAEQVILDITGVPVVDTEVANHLLKTIQAARLLGAECMLVGISSQIAQTLVHLGVDLAQMTTYAKLQKGLQAALIQMQYSITK